MKRKKPNHPGLIPMLTHDQVARHLGVSERTLFRYVHAGKLIAYKLDGTMRYNPADLERFLGKRRVGHGTPAPFEQLPPETQFRTMTDEEAQAFFEGLPTDEDGNIILGHPDGTDE